VTTPVADLLRILVIVGPTAVGKSETALIVARELDCEIVSADSRQVYRGLEIGSGAPTPEERAEIVHHLVATDSPDCRITAGDFARRARSIVEEIATRGKLPLLVGGSGLYIKAIIDGLAETPPSDLNIGRSLQEELASRGVKALLAELQEIDPEYSILVGERDLKRLFRALEVWRITGKRLSDWHKDSRQPAWIEPLIYGLERPLLERREMIRNRVHSMIKHGWIAETRELMHTTGIPAAAAEAVGYGQIARAIAGEISFEQAIEETIIATQQFAKRQMTWFRADKRIIWLTGSGPSASHQWAEEILNGYRRLAEIETGI